MPIHKSRITCCELPDFRQVKIHAPYPAVAPNSVNLALDRLASSVPG
jgi:hypothetical protein